MPIASASPNLHQLRGRVGRGAHASVCWLVTAQAPAGDPVGNPRVEALVASTDGFQLAEVDLDLRGEGTIMNTAQKGRNDLKLASLRRDRELGHVGARCSLRDRRSQTRSSTTIPYSSMSCACCSHRRGGVPVQELNEDRLPRWWRDIRLANPGIRGGRSCRREAQNPRTGDNRLTSNFV